MKQEIRRKEKKTDYVKRQYIGNLGKIENGIVSVNAYGYCEGMTFPLKFKVFKPRERLKEGDKYKTKRNWEEKSSKNSKKWVSISKGY